MAIQNGYKTYLDYENATGIYKILYPVRDAIGSIGINPFFVILFGLMLVLTVGSYYTYLSLSGRSRFFNSLLASSFVVTIVSWFWVMAELVTPYTTLTFIGISVIALALAIFYK